MASEGEVRVGGPRLSISEKVNLLWLSIDCLIGETESSDTSYSVEPLLDELLTQVREQLEGALSVPPERFGNLMGEFFRLDYDRTLADLRHPESFGRRWARRDLLLYAQRFPRSVWKELLQLRQAARGQEREQLNNLLKQLEERGLITVLDKLADL